MKNYIIAALCLAAVWGCSEEIPIIEGMVIINKEGNFGDTLGTSSKVGTHSEDVVDYDIIGYPNILFKGDKVTFNLFNPVYYKLKLEKAKIGEELLMDLESRYVANYIQPKSYSYSTMETRVINNNSSSVQVDFELQGYESGAYLLTLMNVDEILYCMPVVIVSSSENPFK